jgi:hypothetical protein
MQISLDFSQTLWSLWTWWRIKVKSPFELIIPIVDIIIIIDIITFIDTIDRRSRCSGTFRRLRGCCRPVARGGLSSPIRCHSTVQKEVLVVKGVFAVFMSNHRRMHLRFCILVNGVSSLRLPLIKRQ